MIVPTPKDGEKSVPTNYRPISYCGLLFPKSWSITFTARSCYIYKLRTQLVINSGASVQKNPQSMHFSQLRMAGSNHLRQELTLELFFSTSLRPLTQCLIGHCWKNFYGLNKYLIKCMGCQLPYWSKTTSSCQWIMFEFLANNIWRASGVRVRPFTVYHLY